MNIIRMNHRRLIAWLLIFLLMAGLFISIAPNSFAADGGTIVKSVGDFTSEVNINIKGKPAGTLFQVDELGKETGSTGFSSECFQYYAYASTDGTFCFGKSKRADWKNATLKIYIDNDKTGKDAATGMTAYFYLKGKDLKATSEGTVLKFEFTNKTNSSDIKTYIITVFGVNTNVQNPVINGLTVNPSNYYNLPWDSTEFINKIYLSQNTEKADLCFNTDDGVKLYKQTVAKENELAKSSQGKYIYETDNFEKVNIIASFTNENLGIQKENKYEFLFIKKDSTVVSDAAFEVVDYNPAAGQFVKRVDIKNGEADFLLKPTTRFDKYLSLGGFGGYITFKFKEHVLNSATNPYGVDFIVYGNGFAYANSTAPELGNVLVSEDGNSWYTLAGSRHYELMTGWNREATLKDGSKINAVLLAKKGENNIEDIAPKAVFGYADYHKCSGIENAQEEYTITAKAANPYATEHVNNIGDCFDLSWAVDQDGKPVKLNSIQYVRVQSAVDIVNKVLGENSVEVGTLARAVADNEAVGKTNEASSLTINGKDVLALTPVSTIEENNTKYYELDLNDQSKATVKVSVKGASEDNISVNNEIYQSEANYTGLLKSDGSRMLRVILQNGRKEPVIYVIKCTGGGDPATNADLSSVVLTPGDQIITEEQAANNLYSFNVANNIENIKLKLNALNPNISIKVSGIGGSDVNFKSGIISDNISLKEGENSFDITTTSTDQKTQNKYIIKVNRQTKEITENEDNLKVSFTLNGDDKHGEKGKHKEQVWIKTTTVQVPKGSTVKYLTDMMLYNAGIDFDDTDGNYISKIKGPGVGWLGEFDNGPNSGWMYRQNGKIANDGYAKRKLKNNDEILWFYTDDYKIETGYEGNWDHENSAAKTDDQKASAKETVQVTAKSDSEGKAAASVSSKDMIEALKKALEAVKNSSKELIPEVSIAVKADEKANTVVTTLPTSSAKDIVKEKGILSLTTPTGDIRFNQEALSALAAEAGGSDIKLTIEKVDASSNPVTTTITELAGRPVFNLSAISNGKEITDFKSGKVTFYLPYTLGANEKKENLRMVHISDKGVQEAVEGASYDEAKKAMKGETNHFSYYAVTYSNIQFTDVTSGKWFYDSVMYLANKGIVKGKAKTTFNPDGSVTRAEFAQILYNKSGAPQVTNSAIFTDVSDNAWYAKAVNWAAEKNISKGFNGKFNPNANISREDMAVMLKNYLENVDKKELAKTAVKQEFSDKAKISPYAEEAIEIMQTGGIINGYKAANGLYSFKPSGNATRAEATSMMASLFQKLEK
nr:S-layer homology domain-containing protein [uncultured Aminipila sp.]